jgi:hypothetical protein
MPQKIDDFDASFQGQQAGPGHLGRADETLPERAGEKWRQKGDFLGHTSFAIAYINKQKK